MADNIQVPDTMKERYVEYAKNHDVVLPHPDSKIWYQSNVGKELEKKFTWSSPYDARFGQYRIQRKCFTYYVDYFRCKELMGEDYKPCKFFWNVYNDTCPGFWTKKWDELREDGRFPAKFDR